MNNETKTPNTRITYLDGHTDEVCVTMWQRCQAETHAKVKKPQAHPHPCPDKYILMALGKATEDERRMIRLAAECGLRRSEIAAVNSDDVMDDLLGKSLIVRGKGDKQRIVPCPDDLAAEIQACGGYLFPGRWSGHVEASYVGKHITRLLPDGWWPTRYGTGTPPEPMSQHMTCTW